MTYHNAEQTRGRIMVVRPGEGTTLPGPEGITMKATAHDTGGSIGFVEATSEAGFGPPSHIHYENDEIFYVLEGTFQFLLDEQVETAGPGSLIFIPRGTVHAPKVVGDQPGRVLIAFVPGGAELSFEEFSRIMAERQAPLTSEEAQAIAQRYASEFVGPPL